jgi:hypothetical protein
MTTPVQPVADAQLRQPPPNLADPATREQLTPAAIDGIVRLVEIWHLTSAEICALLGNISERTWFGLKDGDHSGALSEDMLTRFSALAGVFEALRLLFSEQLADEWVGLPNQSPLFSGLRPLDAMIEGGIPRIIDVRRHIDALRIGP